MMHQIATARVLSKTNTDGGIEDLAERGTYQIFST